jgi:hypothetical protein
MNMKKRSLLVFTLLLSLSSIAQEAAEKKVQAGIVLGSGINFQKMMTKRMETNGVGTDLTVGANVLINLSETIGFTTGLEFDFERLNYKAPSGSPVYYYFRDAEILSYKDREENGTLFEVSERNQKATYLTIPTMLSFRTNFFGYWRYFGKFGLRNSFLVSSKTTDDGYIPEIDQNMTNTDMVSKNDLFFLKSAVGVCAGAEWNFSGSTSLIAELGYYYGFTPLHTQKKTDVGDERNSLFTLDEDLKPLMFNNKANQNQIMLKVSILF